MRWLGGLNPFRSQLKLKVHSTVRGSEFPTASAHLDGLQIFMISLQKHDDFYQAELHLAVAIISIHPLDSLGRVFKV